MARTVAMFLDAGEQAARQAALLSRVDALRRLGWRWSPAAAEDTADRASG